MMLTNRLEAEEDRPKKKKLLPSSGMQQVLKKTKCLRDYAPCKE